jgi:alcohol dehydrogenase (cytochrome c)
MPSYGLLTAFDVTTGLKIAQQGNPYPSKSGMLATAGGLVFTAFENGELAAYTDDTLQKVWHFNTGAGVKSPFNSYSVNGKQFLSIVVAGRLQTARRDEIPVRGWMSTLFVFSL